MLTVQIGATGTDGRFVVRAGSKMAVYGYLLADGTLVHRYEHWRDELLDIYIRRLVRDAQFAAQGMAFYGIRTGRCGRCGRRLTDPESIRRGIGPECAALVRAA